MKASKTFAAILFMLIAAQLFSCTKETDEPGGGGSGSGTYTQMFWSDQAGSSITVKIDGGSYTGSVSSYYSSSSPTCGASGCYTATLPAGSHSYTATDGTHNWTGTVSGTSTSGCKTLKLFW